MNKKKFADVNALKQRQREITEELCDLYDKVEAEKRELNQEEKNLEDKLSREFNLNKREIETYLHGAELEKFREVQSRGEQFREYLQGVRSGQNQREVTLAAGSTNPASSIEASGAINLSIHDILPTLKEGLGLPTGLKIVTGVVGNEVWPVSVNDVQMEEVGEVEAISDQSLDFAKLNPVSRRVALSVSVSNNAVDNTAFDLLGFVQQKFELAQKEYLAKKIYSQAAWSGNKGPFSGVTAAGTITVGATAYKDILKAVASFTAQGFVGDVCLTMDPVTEAELKATPKAEGAGFIIEGDKCAGYDYTVSHYLNTKLDATGKKLTNTEGKFLAIGYWDWFALQQHGDVRLTIDSISAEVAKKNVTAIVLNTNWSMTDLSVKANGNTNGKSQAFAIFEVNSGAEEADEV